MQKTIDLAIAFDQNYLPAAYTLLTSIFLNNRSIDFSIHSIASGIDEIEKEKLIRYVNQNGSTIHFYAVNPQNLHGLILPRSTSYHSIATYYRLFFPSLIPSNVTKLLYLDVDIIVTGDLWDIVDTNLETMPAAAVPEVNATRNRPDLGLDEVGSYFNAGVLLMNVALWKEQKISEKAIDFVLKYPERVIWADQDALNVVLKNNYIKLDERFNIGWHDVPRNVSRLKYRKFLKNKVIIHFTLKKPWNAYCDNRLRFLYYRYEKFSPVRFPSRYSDLLFSRKKIYRFVKLRVKESIYDLRLIVNISN